MKRSVEELLPKDVVDETRAALPHVATIGMKLTDLGNAERLVARNRDRIRYCSPRRRWLVYDGKRWAWDETEQIIRFAKLTARAIYAEAEHASDPKGAEVIARHATKSEDGARLKAMVVLAQSEAGIPVLPSELDSDPWLLNVENGTLDLRTEELRPHRRTDLITKLAPVVYDPGARNETWERFLNETTGGDAELAAYLQRIAGYSLTGLASEKKFFFVYGPRDTAKSTFIDALMATWGGYAESADFSTWLEQTVSGGNRGDLVRLAGARLVTSVEVKKGKRWDEALIKRVVGGDTIVASAKYEGEVAFKATFKLVLAGNDAPAIRDDDEGMLTRAKRVPFPHQVKVKDPSIKATLSDPAKAGAAILAWAVRGCIDWQRNGLGTSSLVEASTAAYREEMDRVAGFFAECCAFEDDDLVRVSRKALRGAYETWCSENDVRQPLGPKDFTARLRGRGAVDGKVMGTRVWRRVRLLGPNEEPSGAVGAHRGTLHGNFSTRTYEGELLRTDAPTCPGAPDDDIEREAIQAAGGGE